MNDEQGQLVEWDDARGFGFIAPTSGGRLFIHIKAFAAGPRRPLPGDTLDFVRGRRRDGGAAAISASIRGLTVHGPHSDAGGRTAPAARLARIAAAAAVLLGVIWVNRNAEVGHWLLALYLIMGAISFFSYRSDKAAARLGIWRVPEATLLRIDLCFGLIGGLLAQAAFHHKTAKPLYGVVTAMIVFLHLAGLAVLASGMLASV